MAVDRPLTPMQRRFVDEYIIDLNAFEAARRAEYSDPNIGRQLITKNNVAAAIKQAMAAREKATRIESHRVLKELAIVGFSDIGAILDFSGDDIQLRKAKEISADARRMISKVKIKRRLDGPAEDRRKVELVEFDLWPKLKALDDIGRHLGMWDKLTPLDAFIANLPSELRQPFVEAMRAVIARQIPATPPSPQSGTDTGGTGTEAVSGQPSGADSPSTVPG